MTPRIHMKAKDGLPCCGIGRGLWRRKQEILMTRRIDSVTCTKCPDTKRYQEVIRK